MLSGILPSSSLLNNSPCHKTIKKLWMILCSPEESLSISHFAEDEHAAGMLDDVVLPGVDGEDFAAVGYLGRPVLSYGHLFASLYVICTRGAFGCTEVAFGCTAVVFGCTKGVFSDIDITCGCTGVAFGPTGVVFGCRVIVFGCTGVVIR